MGTAQKKAVRSHRRRLKDRGLQRVEVQVSEHDAQLIRRLGRLLREDDEKAAGLRQQLSTMVGAEEESGLKVLLAAAPLQGVRITRSRDRGRSVDL